MPTLSFVMMALLSAEILNCGSGKSEKEKHKTAKHDREENSVHLVGRKLEHCCEGRVFRHFHDL